MFCVCYKLGVFVKQALEYQEGGWGRLSEWSLITQESGIQLRRVPQNCSPQLSPEPF